MAASFGTFLVFDPIYEWFSRDSLRVLPARPFGEQVSYLTFFATCEQVFASVALSNIPPIRQGHQEMGSQP
ncbi:MAG: hypothetical protein ACHP8A_15985, partial [Terriglobales bacterium]